MRNKVIPYNTYTIYELETLFNAGKLDFNTEYQRSAVWKLPRKKKLIDSIIKGYSIGMIFLRENDGRFEVLDGQQRLRSLFEFMGLFGKDKIFLTDPNMTPEFGDKTYEDIKNDPKLYPHFISFKIPYALVRDVDDETTADIFLRLQEGIPLNTAEKLNAMKGKMRELIFQLSKHSLLRKTDLDDSRFSLRLLCAQIAILERKAKLESFQFPDIKFNNLREMYEKYKSKDPPKWLGWRIKSIFNLLEKILEEEAKIISRRGDFIPIYLLVSYIKDKFVIKGSEEKIKNFILRFMVEVDNINLQKDSFSRKEKPYREYKIFRSAGALSSRSFEKRFEIILTKFLEFVPELIPKAEVRFFNRGQKLAIYYRDKGKCKICGKKISFDEAEPDHVIPYDKGGPTNLTNAQLTCIKCNRSKAGK